MIIDSYDQEMLMKGMNFFEFRSFFKPLSSVLKQIYF